MRLYVNGSEVDVEPASTVRDVIRATLSTQATCAVEVNRRLVPARQHAHHQLSEGDRLEIVTLVGGG